MTFFDCFNIVNINLKKPNRVSSIDVANSVLAYDFYHAVNDEDIFFLIKYLKEIHKLKRDKFKHEINFGIKDLNGVSKYNIYELINLKPTYISLGGAYSNLLVGGYKEDGAFTNFGKYIFNVVQENNILIDVSEVSESCFFEIMQCSKKPLIATHVCLDLNNSKLPHLRDYQTKMLVEQNGLICFLLEGKKSLKRCADDINRFVEIYGTKHLALGSGQERIKHTGYYVRQLKSILSSKGYPEEAINDIFTNNLKNFLSINNAN